MSLISLERGSGNPFEVDVANPAAGVEWSLTVPVGQRYRLETLFFLFQTSAVVANRIAKIDIKNASGGIVWEGGNQSALAASGVYRVSGLRLGPYAQASGGGVPIQVPLPDLWLPPGFVVTTNTGAIDVGDQYSVIRLMVTPSSDAD